MLVEQRSVARTRLVHVNVDDAADRRFWCERLACTEQQLREAVRAAGTLIEDLRRHLGKYVRVETADQRRRWCRRLDCGELELFDAVSVVGSLAVDVRRHLRRRNQLHRAVEAIVPTNGELRRNYGI